MKRSVLAIAAGFIAWIVIATALNWLVRIALPGYSAVERTMEFTLAMLLCRLIVGALATVGSGFVTSRVATRNPSVATVTGVVLLLVFLPQHYVLLDKFPWWYHLVFLGSLVPLAWLGGRMSRASAAADAFTHAK